MRIRDPKPDRDSRARTSLWLVAAAALAARALFLWWSDPRAISADLHGWERVVAALSAGQNPYNTTTNLNWPPLWMQALFVLGKVASALNISVVHAIQGFLAAADVGLILATDRLMAVAGIRERRALLFFGIALNPIGILLTCQQGNFDVLVATAVVLCLTELMAFARAGEADAWLTAALFLGLGAALKGAPVVLMPLLAAGARRLSARIRILGIVLACGPALYGLSVLYPLGPSEITRHIFGYRSVAGWFGVTGILHWLRLDAVIPLYGLLFAVVLGVGVLSLALQLRRGPPQAPRRLLPSAILLLGAFPFLGSGYGPQYILWFWPLLLAAAALGSSRLRIAIGVFAVVATATYVVDYALTESLGSFLLYKIADPSIELVCLVFRSNRAAALANAPLFLAYALLFVQLLRELSGRDEDRGRETAAAAAAAGRR